MVTQKSYKSRDEWLSHRTSMIGGSDAAAVLGVSPWISNAKLWAIKTGLEKQEDISDYEPVKYGTEAEVCLRKLFALDFPQYKVSYEEFNMWTNDKYPFAHASLDGWLEDNNGRKGILEIKTTNIMRSGQSDLWKDQIPQYYYAQVIHYLMVTEFDFAILKAQLKYEIQGDVFLSTKHYTIERNEEEIEFLAQREKDFFESLKNKRRPGLILPNL